MPHAMSGTNGAQRDEKDGDDHPDNHQNGPDDAADFPGLGCAPTGGVHSAGVNFLDIGGAENPSHDGEGTANDQAKDAKDEDQRAAMWFHGLNFGLKVVFFYRLCFCWQDLILKHH
jgi:hypothetical protein